MGIEPGRSVSPLVKMAFVGLALSVVVGVVDGALNTFDVGRPPWFAAATRGADYVFVFSIGCLWLGIAAPKTLRSSRLRVLGVSVVVAAGVALLLVVLGFIAGLVSRLVAFGWRLTAP